MLSTVTNKVKYDYSLAEHTTLKIGGNAEMAFFPESVQELLDVVDYLKKTGQKITVVGAGSNLLVSSLGIKGGVIMTSSLKGYEMLSSTTVKVDSGMKSTKFAKVILEQELTGLEFLVGIPGTVGGAVVMNSSAHGQAIKDTIVSADVYDLKTGELMTLDKEALNLSYRSSFVEKNRHLILSAVFELKKASSTEISEKMQWHVDYRAKNHPPLTEPNAGSTFRNPEDGVYVGKMLQELGAKGWIEGGAKISEKHANFLYNFSNATSTDVSKLMYRMYTGIKAKYGYDLIAEIRYVGEFTPEEESIWNQFQVH